MNNRPLQAKDLMVGDWIADKDGDKVCVENIISSEFDCYYGIDVVRMNRDGRCDKWTVAFEEAQPIPLTEAILDKNCADVRKYEDGRSFQWTWENPTGYVELATRAGGDRISDGFFMSCNGGEYAIMVLHYVHELQHALRLAGIGKEIEL